MSVEPSEKEPVHHAGPQAVLEPAALRQSDQTLHVSSEQCGYAQVWSGGTPTLMEYSFLIPFYIISRTLFEQQCVFLCVCKRANGGGGASQWRYC